MKIIPLTELCKQDYNLKFLSYVNMPQSINNATFSCIDQPKKQDLLLYINDCSTQYLTKGKQQITTQNGNLVYIPIESEYEVKCIHDNPNSSTFQINFHLYDNEGQLVKLSDEILIFSPNNDKIRNLFEKLALLHTSPFSLQAEKKAVLYNILSVLAKDLLTHNTPPPLIQPAINYIFTHYHERPQISFLAKLCYVTPEYFRKLFHSYFKISPAKYINSLRLHKACEYLIYSDLSIEQIADILNYCTPTFFISQFKAYFKTTPYLYRKQHK